MWPVIVVAEGGAVLVELVLELLLMVVLILVAALVLVNVLDTEVETKLEVVVPDGRGSRRAPYMAESYVIAPTEDFK